MSNYLNNIPNAEIEDYALVSLTKIKEDLLDTFGNKYELNEGQSITDIMYVLAEEISNPFNIVHFPALNYLVCADIMIEFAHGKMNESTLMSRLNHSGLIDAQIREKGLSIIWNSLPIKSDSLRSSVLIAVLNDQYLKRSDFGTDSEIHFSDIAIYTIRHLTGLDYEDLEEDNYIIHDFVELFHPDILFEKDHESIKDAISYLAEHIPTLQEYSAVSHWMAPLCQTAYIMGKNPTGIIEGAKVLFGAFFDEFFPEISVDVKEQMLRRSLILVSAGFDGLLKELSPTKDDLLYIDNRDMDNSLFNACFSPICGFGVVNGLFDQNNDIFRSLKRSLSISGLDIDIKTVIEADKSDSLNDLSDHLMISCLYINTSDTPAEDAASLIKDPIWDDEQNYHLRFSRSLDFNTKQLISLDLFDRFGNEGYINTRFYDIGYKSSHPIFSLDEQRQLLDKIIEDESVSQEIVDFLEIEDRVLHPKKKYLPSSMRRNLFASDLGL